MPDKAYLNTDLSFEERTRDLVLRMTLEEKVTQMLNDAPAIDRLGVPAYNWWNECLHGVARAGVATVFPQAIGMAAMWDKHLMHAIATAISDEARAKHHQAVRKGEHGIYQGLTFWTPNINIFRDPRWGRGHETYGEDPYLTGRLAVEFVKGLQGDDPKYLKAVATPKHFAAHSGPEKDRHAFDAKVSQKDLRETYLPAFEACICDGKAQSVMGAYNRTNGEPCCASKTLLQHILRDEWGFDGYVVSDCGAIQDIHQHHHVTTCTAESAAISVTNGCDLECGCVYANLLTAVQRGLIAEQTIDRAVTRLFTARFRLGMFDPPDKVRYAQIPYSVNDCDEHRQLAKQAALESIVLLKNAGSGERKADGGTHGTTALVDHKAAPSPLRGGLGRGPLPLRKDLRSLAVIGPNADSLEVLLGNYNGTPSKYVTPLAGIKAAVSPSTEVIYAKGCELLGKSEESFAEAIAAAEKAEAVVMCLGLSPQIEGEQGDAYNSDAGGDRTHMDLTGMQQRLLEKIVAVGKPVVLVLINGSALSINWAAEHVDAIIEAWYPGEEGGTAIAEIIFGDHNPSGRLPVTFYKSMSDLPDFRDYSMKGRTYRYFKGEPLYPFGYGLSYTSFVYTDLKLSASPLKSGKSINLKVTVKNTGDRLGDEVVQLYLSDLKASVPVPTRQLVGFQRVCLMPGVNEEVSFTITSDQMKIVNERGERVLEPGAFRVEIGGWAGKPKLTAEFEVA